MRAHAVLAFSHTPCNVHMAQHRPSQLPPQGARMHGDLTPTQLPHRAETLAPSQLPMHARNVRPCGGSAVASAHVTPSSEGLCGAVRGAAPGMRLSHAAMQPCSPHLAVACEHEQAAKQGHDCRRCMPTSVVADAKLQQPAAHSIMICTQSPTRWRHVPPMSLARCIYRASMLAASLHGKGSVTIGA